MCGLAWPVFVNLFTMWSLQIVSAAATLSSGGTAAAAGLLLPSSLLILRVLVGPIEVLFLVQIIVQCIA